MFHFLRIHTVPTEEEGSTWLQLFFDLVYVAILVELGNRLGNDLNLEGTITFILLFIPIWSSWLEFVDYGQRYPIDDIGQRILTILYMAFMLIMAFEIHRITGSTAITFFITFGISKFILALMYARAWIYYPEYRRLTRNRGVSFLMIGVLWIIVAFVAPTKVLLWAIVIVVGGMMPVIFRRNHHNTAHSDSTSPPFKYHFTLYRFGELTIIVLGEFFIKLVISSTGRELTPINYLIGAGLLSISVCIWWLYFDHLEHANLAQAGTRVMAWVYSHFPFMVGIVSYGVIGNKIFAAIPQEPLPDAKRMLFTGSLAVALLAFGIIEWASKEKDEPLARAPQPWFRVGGASFLLIVGLLGKSINVGWFVLIVVSVLLLEVAVDVYERLRRHDSDDAETAAAVA